MISVEGVPTVHAPASVHEPEGEGGGVTSGHTHTLRHVSKSTFYCASVAYNVCVCTCVYMYMKANVLICDVHMNKLRTTTP